MHGEPQHEANGYLLLKDEGPRQQCCVGIFATACGVPDSELNHVTVLNYVKSADKFNAAGVPRFSDTIEKLYNENDKPQPLRSRRSSIRAGFKALGVKVKFLTKGGKLL